MENGYANTAKFSSVASFPRALANALAFIETTRASQTKRNRMKFQVALTKVSFERLISVLKFISLNNSAVKLEMIERLFARKKTNLQL